MLAKTVFAVGLVKRTALPLIWRDWCRLVLPNGSITGLDIGLSNKSLAHITMSFYTMCKSTTPIFLLAFAFIWGLEQPTWSLAGVVLVIVTGLLLLVKGETKFDGTGFALVMTASCMSGLRFTLTQVLLHGRSSHGQSPFGGPLEVLEALTPVMSATTLLLSLAFEGLWDALPDSPYFDGLQACLSTAGLVFAGAVIAFLMVWAEFEVIRDTSALTFMVAGVVKEIITIGWAILIFGDSFGLINGVGLAVAICGVALFNVYKLRRLRELGSQEVVLVRRPGSSDSGGDLHGYGAGPDAAAAGGAKESAVLVSRAGSLGRASALGGAAGGGSSSGVAWRRAETPGVQDRRRGSGSASGGSGGSGGSGASADEEEGAQEHEPLLLGGGGGGGLSSGVSGAPSGWR
ncbi:hypothetical protein MNEG_7792 [Monoraphidium neglectum]|uniref:Sugar phosphate transporter domain-containing protein n=1 Tax=Monoraphidium neglectum TaxID=145388 RepID=A0A0D2N1R8_9CHLO|nr:hypothetical protein MNEG_7792 [Monoraphidium neglectum]KIZ00166.1 hypothetical protein MNEG_7792 [Monoraphidium neglectum]|eukprot:XP_013899185.1 hypothetical protein MNEG_7792 [Monoraphidium neglectum]